jgi:hypothetical protein
LSQATVEGVDADKDGEKTVEQLKTFVTTRIMAIKATHTASLLAYKTVRQNIVALKAGTKPRVGDAGGEPCDFGCSKPCGSDPPKGTVEGAAGGTGGTSSGRRLLENEDVQVVSDKLTAVQLSKALIGAVINDGIGLDAEVEGVEFEAGDGFPITGYETPDVAANPSQPSDGGSAASAVAPSVLAVALACVALLF